MNLSPPILPSKIPGQARAKPRNRGLQTPPYQNPDKPHDWLIPDFMLAVYYPDVNYGLVFIKYLEQNRTVVKYNLVGIYDKNRDYVDYLIKQAIEVLHQDTEYPSIYFSFSQQQYNTDDTNFWTANQLYTQYVNQNLLAANDLYQIFKVIYPQFTDQQRKNIQNIDSPYHGMRPKIQEIIYNRNPNNIYSDNVVNYVKQYVGQKGYQYKYFTPINPSSPEAQAALGVVNIGFDNFERHSHTFSLEEGEQMLYEQQQEFTDPELIAERAGYESGYEQIFYGKNSTGSAALYAEDVDLEGFNWPNQFGWDKATLVNVIYKSGLMQPNGQQWQLHKINKQAPFTIRSGQVIQRTMVIYHLDGYDPANEYAFAYHFNAPYVNKSDQYIQHQIEQTLLRKNNGILWRNIGINADGFIKALQRPLAVQGKSELGAIYRRIFGTIYTINWNQYCASQKLNYMSLPVLQNILQVYYGQQDDIDPKKMTCQAIQSSTPRIMAMLQNIGNPQQWIQILQQQYINSETFKQADKDKARKKRRLKEDDE